MSLSQYSFSLAYSLYILSILSLKFVLIDGLYKTHFQLLIWSLQFCVLQRLY